MAARFVQETKEIKCYHHACALAINAQVKFRSGLPHEALEEFNKMKKIYNIKDSRAINKDSGLDWCVLTYSRSALWYMEMGDEDNAKKQCATVINLLDDLQSKDPKEMHVVLTPIIAILMEIKQARQMKELYNDHVVKQVHGSMPFYVRNMQLVLAINEGTGVDNDDISWVLSNGNVELGAADHFYITLGLSANTIAAEACFFFAQRSDGLGGCRDAFCEGT